MVNEQELIELLRKTAAASEKMISAWEDQYEISTELKATIEKANKLLQKLDQDKAIQEELPEWNIKKKYEPSLEELLTMPMRHIDAVKKCFEACRSKSDIAKVIKAVPAYLGEFWAEYADHSIIIVNSYFDDEEGDIEEEYWYDYPEDWEEADED